MSNISSFISKQNLVLLWEVLLDELNINKTNITLINNIRIVFESNINPFCSRINSNKIDINIMELNKRFLSQVVSAVNKLFPKEQNVKKITIGEDISEPYKIEDIQSVRQTDFEKEFERKRIELETYMTPQKPKDVNFLDDININNEKIQAMDSLIAEKMAQRELDLQNIHNYDNNTNIHSIHNNSINSNNINNNSLVETWLTSKETSVKNEKHEKKVSWNMVETNTTNNIFEKLKKIKHIPMDELNESNESNEVNNISEFNQYVQQTSITLPEVKQEEINRDKIMNNSSILGEPVIPKTEIVKQLNVMNDKIDKLFEVVSKLTNELLKNKNNDLDLD